MESAAAETGGDKLMSDSTQPAGSVPPGPRQAAGLTNVDASHGTASGRAVLNHGFQKVPGWPRRIRSSWHLFWTRSATTMAASPETWSPSVTPPRFSVELQSMRGIVALIVLISHCVFVPSVLPGGARYLFGFLNGGGAVSFFFVLSGAVLALSLEDKPLNRRVVTIYSVRRAFRILPMLVAATTLGTLYCNLINRHSPYPFASIAFNESYAQRIDLSHYLASLVGYSAASDPPLWSIFVELIGSLAVPIMLFTARPGSARFLVGALLLGLSLWKPGRFQYAWPIFLLNFYVGITIVWWGRSFARRVSRLPGILVAAMICLLLAVFLGNRVWRPPVSRIDSVSNLLEIAATAPLIALGLYMPRYLAILRHRSLLFLGDISYSLYLLHYIILSVLVQGISCLVPAQELASDGVQLSLVLAALTSLIVVGISAFTLRFVETPMIALGRKITSRL